MVKQWTAVLMIFSMTIAGLFAQKADDRVLFTVEGNPVGVEEFTYIYAKTNGDKADFSEPTLQEYLDLYVKFKLKVQRAKEMRLDTIKALQEELAGYRRQLADSYLVDRAIGDRLISEAYDHLKQDVDISHILVAMKTDASPADTLAAHTKAMATLERINKGAAFADVAKEVSDDRYSKDRGGRVGFTTALYPAGLYNLEYAAYQAPLNKVTGPIRTNAGYHLLLVHERRPARGEVEAAHIMMRTDNQDEATAKARIDSVYQALQGGAAFDALAKAVSQDERTASNGGYIGFFGISRYEKPFEDAAFGITADEGYSKPFKTSLGWHVIKRISRKEIQPFAAEKPRLEGKVRQDPRFDAAKKALLVHIRQDNHFTENTAGLNEYIASLPDTFNTFRWKAEEPLSKLGLFSLDGGYQVTMGDFATYLSKSTRERVSYAREGDNESVARRLYAQFVDDQLLKYEESQLEQRYPEFRSLMREYEEGILLFEATKLEVWDKAAQDSVGLEKFYTGVAGKYRWAPRAKTTTYRVGLNYKDEAEAVRAYAQNHTAEEVKARFNTPETMKVVTEESLVEQFRAPELSAVGWQTGSITPLEENQRSKNLKFVKIEAILPEANKTLAEARGYVIADYQDELEREWVEALRNKYKVVINQKVFKSLVR